MSVNAVSVIDVEQPVERSLLQTLIPFNILLDDHLEDLLGCCSQQLLFAGGVLFERGSFDDRHYFLLHGELECRYGDGRTERIKSRRSRTAIAPQRPRDCSVVAVGDCRVVSVDRERLDKLLAWSQVAEYLLVDVAYDRDLDEDLVWINTVLKSNLFLKVPPTNVQSIFSCLHARTVEAGEVIIRQGELGDCCYFIKEGGAEVSRVGSDGGREHLADITVGRCFGEDALLQEAVRNASVVMRTAGVLMQLDKRDFLKLLKKPPVSEITWPQLEAQLAGESLASGEAMVAIDVRSEEEYALGHVHGSINLPLNILRLKSRVLDAHSGKQYLLYCNSGRRSVAAAFLLGQLGFNVTVLAGGLDALGESEKAAVWSLQDYVLKQGALLSGQ